MKRLFSFATILLVIMLTGEMVAQPSPPILISPVNNATGVSLFPTFDWSDVTGAISYRLQVFQGASTVLDQSGITASQYSIVSAILSGNTTYYWRVNVTTGAGTSAWTSSWYFTTGNAPPVAPLLSSPLNGAVDISLTPTLSWNDVTGASSYRVQVSTSSSFTTTVVDVSGITNSGYSIPPGVLSNSTIYYWRVYAINSGGQSPWSDIWHFTTIPAPPPPPTLLLPANNATNVSLTPTIDWSDASGATAYHIQISQNSTFSNIVYENTNVTVSTVSIPSGYLSGQTTYYWRVASKNNGGTSAFSSYFAFTTMLGAPSAPILSAPPNNATGVSLTPTLDWNDVPSASSYRVQVSNSPSFGTLIVNMVTGSSSNYTIPGGNLANNTDYYWRVNATNSGGTSAWSTVWHFTTRIAAPPTPVLISPPNNSTGVPLSPTLDWNDVTGADYYRLQVSTTNTFTTTVLDVTNITVSSYEIASGLLTGNTLYYWRVSAYNSGGQSSWTAAWNFRTQNTFFLNIKIFLEGFYNTTYHVQDTVRIYLALPTSPYSFRDSAIVFLGSDGTVNAVSFAKATNGSYYIVIKHRNHIETWSSNSVPFTTGGTVTYDFTTASSKAYGNNMKQVGSVWVLYGGDGNADGFVNPSDYDLFKTQFGLDGYRSCDFNGEGYVDGYDLPIIYANFGKSLQRPY